MSRTPYMRQLKVAASIAKEASARNVEIDQVIAERLEKGISRREFLQHSLLAAAALAVPPTIWSLGSQSVNAATAPRIVVVGAGLAGLVCTYRLKQAGYTAQLYEASNRVGGRCWSIRDYFSDGQVAEHGGELIDTGHTELIELAAELGLELDDLLAAEKNNHEPFFYFNQTTYPFRKAAQMFREIWDKLQADVEAADYPTLYNSYTPRGYQLDHMSILDWIDESVPGGSKSQFGKLLDVAYNIEYGGESSDQSALNLLYLLGDSEKNRFELFGESDERYHIRGGNDQVPARLAEKVKGQIHTGSPLAAIRKNSDGTYRLSFDKGSGTKDVTADLVVLAIPFSILRHLDIGKAGFRPLKLTAIQEYGMGTNTKLAVQFTDRHWEALRCNGLTYSDTGYQNTWDVTRAQPGKSGILVDFTGGDVGKSFNRGDAQSRAKEFLGQIEPVLPGLTAKWNGKATLDYWTGYRWTQGSYSYYRVGQYTKFAGIEGESEGDCHFAGEHTSIDYQGYLNGAVETGERTARELLSKLKAAVGSR
ncbi:flavin monoamine oxidase family protein [Brevibacillus sp. B_LB10_24]|uniref:flavin monoamine oxidase family protein n=1 Tax=Brevibacillus sp. B_LB10_24 TaxID=3380645 RepID=UPI0038B88A1B